MTKMYIGTDIVEISRFERIIKDKIPTKIFTPNETDYISSKKKSAQSAAGIFAAKEAIVKCLGTGLSLPLCDIDINHCESGKPYATLSGKVQDYASLLGITDISVSISHDGKYAVAYAAAQPNKYVEYYTKALKKLENSSEYTLTNELIGQMLPKRKAETHKGDYGRLLVIAGSKGLTGAAILSCNSALRCGAGLITLGCANSLSNIFESGLTEVMTKTFADTDGILNLKDKDKITECIRKADVCLIGPGLGRTEDITSLVHHIITNVTTPCILDADALYAVSHRTDVLKNASCPIILTPHIGEFSYLTGINSKEILTKPDKLALAFAKKYHVTLVLKSHRTLVCSCDGSLFENILGNPGMATGGTGDVLAGCIASFVSQGHTMENAAKLGVYLHSLAADMAALDKGEYSLIPSDITDFLPFAIKLSKEL